MKTYNNMKTKLFKLISILSIILIMSIISGCNNNQLVNKNNNNNNNNNSSVDNNQIIIDNTQVRPDIPITNNNNNNGSETQGNLEQETTKFANSKQYTFYAFLNSENNYFNSSLDGFRIGNNHKPFTIGERLGDIVPYLTDNELMSFISKPAGFGQDSLKAKQFLRFDFDDKDTDEDENSGVLRFTRDERDKTIGTELFFEEDKPIFELAYLLLEGSFKVAEGEEIGLFGVNYVIQEAYNTSLILFGEDKAQYLELINDSELRVNGTIIPNTLVEVDPWHFTIRVFADDQDINGIILREGESLRDKLPPEVFMNDNLDLVFEGIDGLSVNQLELEGLNSKAKIKTLNLAGELLEFDFAKEDNGGIEVYNKNDRFLHLEECKSFSDYCINDGDSFLMIDELGNNRLMTFRSSTEYGKFLKFRDNLGEEHIVKTSIDKRIDDDKIKDYNEEFNATNETMVALVRKGAFMFGDDVFKLKAYFNRSTGKTKVSVDLDDDGRVNSEKVPLIIDESHKLLFYNNSESGTMNITFVSRNLTKNRNFINNNVNDYDEIININLISDEGVKFNIGDSSNDVKFEQIFVDNKAQDDYFTITNSGVEISLTNSDGEKSEKISFSTQPSYREGIVIVKG